MPKWSYEIISESPDPTWQVPAIPARSEIKYIQTSETIVAESGPDALQYAIERLAMFPNRELIGVIRRHPIIDILPAKE